MPDYKPSQRKGFPKPEQPQKSNYSWVGGCLLLAAGIYGLIFMVYSINMAKHTPLQYNPYLCGGIGVVVLVAGLAKLFSKKKAE
jgi:hypothetical protein